MDCSTSIVASVEAMQSFFKPIFIYQVHLINCENTKYVGIG